MLTPGAHVLVALSGYGNHTDVTAAIEAGFDEHIGKARLDLASGRGYPEFSFQS